MLTWTRASLDELHRLTGIYGGIVADEARMWQAVEESMSHSWSMRGMERCPSAEECRNEAINRGWWEA